MVEVTAIVPAIGQSLWFSMIREQYQAKVKEVNIHVFERIIEIEIEWVFENKEEIERMIIASKKWKVKK